MNTTALMINVFAFACLFISFIKNKEKTKQSLRVATKSFFRVLPMVFILTIFLSAWACIKIPQEMVELQFLRPRFMAARLVLTIVFVVIMGISIERIIEWSAENPNKSIGGKNDESI